MTPDAAPLFLSDGSPTGVWFCTTCRYVGPSEHAAKTCCAPKVCEDCCTDYERSWVYSVCPACQAVRHVSRLQAAWDKAPKWEGPWDGPVVTDDCEGSCDGFWQSIDELEDWLEDEGLPRDSVRVYITDKHYMSYDASDLIAHMCEDMHEDEYLDIPQKAHNELQASLNAWIDKWGTVTYVQSKTALHLT